jgi:hypothetical protein
MSLFVILPDEQDKVQRLRDALSDLLAMCPFVTMPENCAEHNWQRRVAAAKATMKTETKHVEILQMHEWRIYNNRRFRPVSYRLVSYQSLGAGWIPAAQIRESTGGIQTIIPICGDTAKPFATEEEANNAASAMAITWMNSN